MNRGYRDSLSDILVQDPAHRRTEMYGLNYQVGDSVLPRLFCTGAIIKVEVRVQPA